MLTLVEVFCFALLEVHRPLSETVVFQLGAINDCRAFELAVARIFHLAARADRIEPMHVFPARHFLDLRLQPFRQNPEEMFVDLALFCVPQFSDELEHFLCHANVRVSGIFRFLGIALHGHGDKVGIPVRPFFLPMV